MESHFLRRRPLGCVLVLVLFLVSFSWTSFGQVVNSTALLCTGCLNGGTGARGPSGCGCVCPPLDTTTGVFFRGQFCEIQSQQCDAQGSFICDNGGTCVASPVVNGTAQSFSCLCVSPFTGNQCEIKVDNAANVTASPTNASTGPVPTNSTANVTASLPSPSDTQGQPCGQATCNANQRCDTTYGPANDGTQILSQTCECLPGFTGTDCQTAAPTATPGTTCGRVTCGFNQRCGVNFEQGPNGPTPVQECKCIPGYREPECTFYEGTRAPGVVPFAPAENQFPNPPSALTASGQPTTSGLATGQATTSQGGGDGGSSKWPAVVFGTLGAVAAVAVLAVLGRVVYQKRKKKSMSFQKMDKAGVTMESFPSDALADGKPSHV